MPVTPTIRGLNDTAVFPALTGAGTAAGDLFLIYDVSVGALKTVTRAELKAALGAQGAVVMDSNGDATVTRRLGIGGAAGTNLLTLTSLGGVANFAVWSNGTQQLAAGVSAGNLPLIGTLTNTPLLFFANNAEVMRYTPGTGLGIGVAPTAGTTSILHLAGDLGFNADNRSILGNLYYSGGWKYYANGYGYSIRPNASGLLQINTAPNNSSGAGAAATVSVRLNLDQTNGHFYPGGDNVQTCGASGNRWSVVHAGTATINTSGRATKMGIREATDAERRAARRILDVGPKLYRFKDAYDAKGDAARLHAGYIAEDVRDALEAEGLDPWRYGFLCADPVTTIEEYTVEVERPKVRKVEVAETVIEVRDGRAVRVQQLVQREEPVGTWLPVFEEDGTPVVGPDGQPLVHFAPEMETVTETRTREVATGEMRLGLRYSELWVYLQCALQVGH